MYPRILYIVSLFITIWMINSNSIKDNSLYGQGIGIDKTGKNEFTKSENGAGLDFFVKEALARNPRIQSFRDNLEANISKKPAAGAWADPKLSLGIMNFPVSDFDFGLEPMTSKQIGLAVDVPIFGINSVREKISESDVSIAESTLNDITKKIVRDISTEYYSLYFTDRAIEVTLENEQIISDIYKLTLKKYEIGRGLQQDIIRAQLELNKLQDKLISLRAKRESVTARLNRLTAREADTEIALTKLIEEPKILPNKDEIIKSAVSNNSYLNSLSGLITKRKAQNNLAEKSYFPKLGVGTFYSQRDDRRDFFSVQFSMSLPLWSGRKQKKYIEAARLNVSAVENMYRDEKNSIQAKAVELYNILNEKKERLRLYKTVMIPRAEHSAASALSAYRTDRADFLTYLDSRSLLLNFEIEYYRLLTDYKKNAAGLEYLVGKNFNRIKKEGESHE